MTAGTPEVMREGDLSLHHGADGAANYERLRRALARWRATGARYAVIPHALLDRLRVAGYPLDDLDPGDVELCGEDGFARRHDLGVDLWCLLPAPDDRAMGHVHGWETVMDTPDTFGLLPGIRRALDRGYRPELDDPPDGLALVHGLHGRLAPRDELDELLASIGYDR